MKKKCKVFELSYLLTHRAAVICFFFSQSVLATHFFLFARRSLYDNRMQQLMWCCLLFLRYSFSQHFIRIHHKLRDDSIKHLKQWLEHIHSLSPGYSHAHTSIRYKSVPSVFPSDSCLLAWLTYDTL